MTAQGTIADNPRAAGAGVSLFRLRIEAGLTIGGLADRAGVAAKTVRAAERGTIPTAGVARRLALALGVAPENIWDRPGDYRPDEDDSPLRRLRHQQCLSGAEAAQRIGIGRSVLMRAERAGAVRVGNAKRIADYYGISVAEVLGHERSTPVAHHEPQAA